MINGPGAPTITAQPEAVTVVDGQTATFSVVATGTQPLSYQWYALWLMGFSRYTPIPGATSASYTTPPTLKSTYAILKVVVTNSAGCVASDQVVLQSLSVLPPPPPPAAPTIMAQPNNATVEVGQTATFKVVASGTAPLTYQWRKNGVDVPGATSASYTTPPTVSADNGAMFSVVVTNSLGSATSASARGRLTVNDPPPEGTPKITTQPVDIAVVVGQTATSLSSAIVTA